MKSDSKSFELKNLVDGKIVSQVIQGKLWIHYEGQTHCVELKKTSSKRRGNSEGGGSDEVLAPMPGKVTKILTSPNTKVRSGDALVMMEAMKMEYTLKSEIDGVVESIECVEGDQVALGKRLVKLKATEKK